ncbi:AAA domain-containing protein, partial [Haematococcus lacustris]
GLYVCGPRRSASGYADDAGRPDFPSSLAFLLVASVREVIASRTRITTREVAYSDFYTLLDSGRVRAARLESGVGRMYFDMQPLTAPAPAAAAQAATTPAAPMRFQKQYVVKLAERSDSLLVAKILAMGVEYSVLKQTFLSALATTLTTTLAVWIPLLPLLFLFRRIMEDRSSSRKKKSDGRAQPVLTTFADVAGVESAK